MTTLDASYTVAELAREVGIKPYTVRYYERIGLVAAPSRPVVTTVATTTSPLT